MVSEFVRPADIDWIEAVDYYTCLYLWVKTHLLQRSLSELEQDLDSNLFCPIHRSAIVNLTRVRALQSNRNGESEILPDNGSTPPISRRYRRHVQSAVAPHHGGQATYNKTSRSATGRWKSACRRIIPLRPIRQMVDEALKQMSGRFDEVYAGEGRPPIAPERLLRALLLQMLYSVRSERILMEQLEYNLLFRWFAGLSANESVWHPTVFTKNRDRLLEGAVW